MKKSRCDARCTVADEVWIATALLHREHPARENFSVKEIIERVRKEKVNGRERVAISPTLKA